MGKTIGLLIAVVAIWVTVEIYTQGVDGAFGGRLAAMGVGAHEAPRASTAQRASDAVERARAEQQERYDALLPE